MTERGRMFLRLLPSDAVVGDVASLDRVLGDLLDTARATWPDLNLPDGAFLEHLAPRLPKGVPVERALLGVAAADLYLALACLLGNASALQVMERMLLKEADQALGRLGSGILKSEALDALRGQVLTAARSESALEKYSGSGALKRWLRVALARKAQNLLRRSMREQPLGDEVLAQALPTDGDQELAYIKAVYRDAFNAAFRDALSGLDARERNVLRHQVLDGLHDEQIAAIYKVHRITVVRWRTAIREKLFDGTRRLLMERLRVDASEVDSITRMIQSRFEVSIRRCLNESAD